MILDTFRIRYQNGIVQKKNLISHSEYLKTIKPAWDTIEILEKKNKGKETKESRNIKRYLKTTFGEHWFTDDSPLYKAIESNLLECNGEHIVFIENMKTFDICRQMLNELNENNCKKTSLIAIAKIVQIKLKTKINLNAVIFDPELGAILEKKLKKAEDLRNSQANQLPF